MLDFRHVLISQKPDKDWQEITGLPRVMFRLFAPLEFGGGQGCDGSPHFIVSIQASALHHCEPAEELEDTFLYKSLEVCLTELVEGKERLINPATDACFRSASWAQYWNHDLGFLAGIYVPVAEVQKMCNELEEVITSGVKDQ